MDQEPRPQRLRQKLWPPHRESHKAQPEIKARQKRGRLKDKKLGFEQGKAYLKTQNSKAKIQNY